MKLESKDIGKRDPRSACERGGGAAHNITGRDEPESRVFVFWESFFVLRAWWVGQAKLKYVSPFHLAPDEPRAAGREKRWHKIKAKSRRPRRDEQSILDVGGGNSFFPFTPFFLPPHEL